MKKRNSITVIALLFVVALTGVVVFNTFAKYTSEVEKNGYASVASWNFTNDNSDGTTFYFDITSTVNEGTLVSGKIAPGTSGKFDVDVSNTSDVGAEVTVALGNVTNIPTNLKFYKDADHTEELTLGGTITGYLPAQNGYSTATIYWGWEYESGDDAIDTFDGETLNDFNIPVTVTGTQINPSTTISSWGF